MNTQLPLGIGLKDSSTFENFIHDAGSLLVTSIAACAQGQGDSPVYIWGAAGCGKTHLLQSACHVASDRGRTIAYLPLNELLHHPVELLEGMENLDLVCLDNLEAIVGKGDWELAVFSLFNRIREAGGHLLVAANASPSALGLTLPDLVSRLQWGPVFHVPMLDDEDKLKALQLRARNRGLELSDEAGRYLTRHYVREMHALFALLEELDTLSLVEQRRLTIPFLREVLQKKSSIS